MAKVESKEGLAKQQAAFKTSWFMNNNVDPNIILTLSG
jgi:hypothetical protein